MSDESALPEPPDFDSLEQPPPPIVGPQGPVGPGPEAPPAAASLGLRVLNTTDTTARVAGPNGDVREIARTPMNDQMLGLVKPALAPEQVTPGVPPALAPSPVAQPKPAPGGGLLGDLAASNKEMLGGIDKEQLAQAELQAAQKHGFEITSSALAGKAEAERIEAKQQQDHQAWVQTEVSKHIGEINKSIQAIANSHVDPDHYWKVRGTGARIVSVFASALGAFGASLAKTPNYVQESIDNAIKRDIDAQESEVTKTKDLALLKNNQLASFMQRDNTMEQAKLATYAMGLQSAETKAQSLLESVKGDQSGATLTQAIAGLQQKRAQVMNAFALEKAKVLASMAPKQMKLEDELKLRALRVHLPGEKEPRYADRPEQASEIHTAVKTYTDTSYILSKLEDLVTNRWQSMPTGDAQELAKGLYNELTGTSELAAKLGVLSPKDIEFAKKLGDPTSWTQRDATTLKLISAYRERLNTGIHNYYKAQGLMQ